MQPRGELATGCSPIGEHRSVPECRLHSENLYDIASAMPGRQTALACSRLGALKLSDDRLMQILQALAVLLFVSGGALASGRAGPAWVKWAKWGTIVIFATAVMYALVL